MRALVFVWFFCLMLAPLSVAAQDEGAPSAENGESAGAQSSADLDLLFETLKTTKDPAEASLAEKRIFALWSQSSSDTTNLLYQRAVAALDAGDNQLAYDLLTAVTTLSPDFAEGWNELGAANFALDAHDEALIDIERALRLEPRHFGAMLELASIFELYGNKKGALEALRHAYALDPHLPGIENRITVLSREVEGQGI